MPIAGLWQSIALKGVVMPSQLSNWNQIGIMLTPSMMKTRVRTLLGPMLAIALLWVSAACVLGCEKLSKERAAKELSVSSAEIQPANTCEDCPLNSFPKAAGSQRLALQSDAQVQVVIPNSSSLSLIPKFSLFAPSVLDPPIDPPLKRLPSLRI
jgi:hypothetical protein